ncbi:hypothetical protein Ccrd_009309 [Cynara cardunculus var. scolymus]|uniref:glucomannan 4-beta-mannosyltransferase n=1 Tax=Cynara cardunculus var. scolymus TaxID=59895 RepID=A0A103YNE2_CYNCS|nr:hypothetical protein Ccrd_009309 [Cynara cardunculus var. scolymus]
MSRQQHYEFQEWWNKQRENHSSELLFNDKSETPNFLAVELGSAVGNHDLRVDKERTRSARQIKHVWLLKLIQIASSLAYVTTGFVSLVKTVNRRISADSPSERLLYRFETRFYRVIKVFLVIVVLLLVFELLAYSRGWHFSPPTVRRAADLVEYVYAHWLEIRANYLAPPLQNLTNVCILLFLVQSVDRLLLVLGCFWIKFKRIKPVAEFEYSSDSGDVNVEDYPMVLVQIPMCNEREVYQQSISAICVQDWPRERMLVQILDDSDDTTVQALIKVEVSKWQHRGVHIVYRHRLVRTGYKAGNLKSAMNCDYVKDYEFVAIFDADFQPAPDFLKKTLPHFKGNDELALVQTRWCFVNKDENLLTRLQNINLTFHFEVEQQVNGVFINFFGFNGTAGVWRIKALEDCGGWLERTTVEDMDIACMCELPESYAAYKKQQHRWHSGPMQLFRLCFMDIIRSKVSFLKKANLIFLFFLLRKLVLPFYSFTLFCIILPLTMFLPEAQLPAWVVCYIPGIISVLNILPAPRSFPFIVPYLLFENTMSVTKFNAMISGLFKLGSSYEWVVTKKLGRSSESDLLACAETEEETPIHRSSLESSLSDSRKKRKNCLYRKELALAFILLTASLRSLLSAQGIHFYFLLFQGVTFLVVGLDLIGEQVS